MKRLRGTRMNPARVVAVLALGAAVGLGAWLWSFSRIEVQRAEIDGLADRSVDAGGLDLRGPPGQASGSSDRPTNDRAAEDPTRGASGEVVNVLIAGSDSRARLSEQDQVRLSVGHFPGARPDTIILAQIRSGKGALLSIPRDLRVDLCDGRTDKINAAFANASKAGVSPETCLVQTVSELTSIPIHHYVGVDMAGMVEVVDAVGGVELCLQEAKRDQRAGLDLSAGCHKLAGTEALGYVRARSLNGAGDLARVERQQRFVKAFVDEVLSADLFANLPRLRKTADKLSDAVTTDEQLDLSTARRVALTLRESGGGAIAGAVVPGTPTTLEGVWYLEPDLDQAEQLFSAFREGQGHRAVAADKR